MTIAYSELKFDKPADKVKTINVDPIPERIFTDMKKYEVAELAFDICDFERCSNADDTSCGIFIRHRPEDAQVIQIYRIPDDPAHTDLERITHFDIEAGRRIQQFVALQGDDWRGCWRSGGAIMVMDLNGNELFQLWRYWEDTKSVQVLPQIDGELDNRPGKGRFERLTHDDFKYSSLIVSDSNEIMVFASNKQNGRDTSVYLTRLIGSETGAKADAKPFELPSKLLTPLDANNKRTTSWAPASISMDDHYVALAISHSSLYRPLYILDISKADSKPEQVILPGATEMEEETVHGMSVFSRNKQAPNLLYINTNAYGDFMSVVSYDILTRNVIHITTPEHGLNAIHPIPWDTRSLQATAKCLYLSANVEGWYEFFIMPFFGPHAGNVVHIKPKWEGGVIAVTPNSRNGKPFQLVVKQTSYLRRQSLARLDLDHTFNDCQTDTQGNIFIEVSMTNYGQAQAATPTFKTHPPRLMKYNSFDGLEIPCMYYEPNEAQKPVPLVINVHGGPASQANSTSQTPTHGYILNELGCAIIYPNVRGSAGYGKKYMAADDVCKREDSVMDIGALLTYVREHMKDDIDPDRIAVMGGSYGGYMTFACLTHFSSQLTCGLANCGIAHWPSFLRNTAALRRDHRRKEYGDETDPDVLEFLERISPVNNADKISVPMLISHGDNDSRVPVNEAIHMWEIAKSKGIHTELIIGEKEGHGFRQKSVIEYCNAARNQFLERFLVQKRNPTANL